jgi:hypothetical protein
MPRRCRVCGRKLRSPLWRAAGLGPVCARRLGLIRTREPAAAPVRVIAAPSGDNQLSLFEIDDEGAA